MPRIEPTPYSHVIRAVRAIAEQYPKAIYEKVTASSHHKATVSCRYSWGTATQGRKRVPGCGCLLGRALRLELSPGALRVVFDAYDTSAIGYLPCDLVEGTKEEITWLACVQNNQDAGACWGDCVAAADTGKQENK